MQGKRTHKVVVRLGDIRYTSKAMSKARAEKIAARVKAEGWDGKPADSVSVVGSAPSFFAWAQATGV